MQIFLFIVGMIGSFYFGYQYGAMTAFNSLKNVFSLFLDKLQKERGLPIAEGDAMLVECFKQEISERGKLNNTNT